MWLARRGRLSGLLCWPRALFFVLYNYIAYFFAVPLNWAFLLHLALLMLSVYALIGLVAGIDGIAVRQRLAATELATNFIVFMLLQPLLTTAPFAAVHVIVVLAMGLICFVPFVLFARGVAAR